MAFVKFRPPECLFCSSSPNEALHSPSRSKFLCYKSLDAHHFSLDAKFSSTHQFSIISWALRFSICLATWKIKTFYFCIWFCICQVICPHLRFFPAFYAFDEPSYAFHASSAFASICPIYAFFIKKAYRWLFSRLHTYHSKNAHR